MIYTFQNKISGEIHEVEMSMSDYAPYKGPDGKDDEWERVYEAPQINMGVSTAKSIDPWDNNSFVNRTKDMEGTVGDLLDHSSELSKKRAKESLTGEDPYKRKYLDQYSKDRNGAKHISEFKKTIDSKHIRVDL